MMNKMNMNKALAAVALASILGFASAAQAQAPQALWSSIGSAGMIDAACTAMADTRRADLGIRSTGTVIARYAVAPNNDLTTAHGVLHLVANLFDPGPGASLSISLIEVPVGAPGEKAGSQLARTLLSLDSSDDSMLAKQCVTDGGQVAFDFERNVYYVQAVLNWDKLAQPRAPQLRTVQLAVYDGKMCGQ